MMILVIVVVRQGDGGVAEPRDTVIAIREKSAGGRLLNL
jgi:hypothetical protein